MSVVVEGVDTFIVAIDRAGDALAFSFVAIGSSGALMSAFTAIIAINLGIGAVSLAFS